MSRNLNVVGNVITFHFPSPQYPPDDTNERTVRIEMKKERFHLFNLTIDYKSENIRNLANSRIIDVPILTKTEIEEVKETFELPDHTMLIEFLGLLKEKWTNLLSPLDIEILELHEFIAADIEASVPAMCSLNITNDTLAHLTKEAQIRGFGDPILVGNEVPLLVHSMMRNFLRSLDLKRAKRDIISMLKASEIIPKDESISESLGDTSRENLAAALMYIPIKKLRDAMISVIDSEMVVGFSEKMRQFLLFPEDEPLVNNLTE